MEHNHTQDGTKFMRNKDSEETEAMSDYMHSQKTIEIQFDSDSGFITPQLEWKNNFYDVTIFKTLKKEWRREP